MVIRRFIEISSDHDPKDIPDDIHLSRKELAALKDPSKAFHALSARCEIASLRRLLKACAKSRLLAIELNAWNEAPQSAYFRFLLERSTPAIRLPRAKGFTRFPKLLQQVYRCVGGIQDDEYPLGGSLLEPEDVGPIGDTGVWFSEDLEMDTSACHIFLETLNGDYYGFDRNGGALRYNHEIGRIQDAGSLKHLLDRYFKSFIVGKKM